MKDLGIGHIKLQNLPHDAGFNFSHVYHPAQGTAPLIEAISLYENTPPETILVTTGASLGLVCSLCLLPKNSTVLCPFPYYPAYPAIIRNLGLNIQYYYLKEEDDWKIPVDDIINNDDPSLSGILLNIPGNPAGNLCSGDDLDKIMAFARGKRIKIISDEVYAPIIYTGDSISCLSAVPGENIIVVKSLSKIFMLPGERIGYILAAPALIAALTRIQWSLAMSAPAYGQHRAVQLLRQDTTMLVSSIVEKLKRNRILVKDMLGSSRDIIYRAPPAGIFYWLKMVKKNGEIKLFHERLARKDIIVMPGHVFGEKFYEYIRINFAVPQEDLKEAIEEILLLL